MPNGKPFDEDIILHGGDAEFTVIGDKHAEYGCSILCFSCGVKLENPMEVYWQAQTVCEHGVPEIASPICKDCVVAGRKPDAFVPVVQENVEAVRDYFRKMFGMSSTND